MLASEHAETIKNMANKSKHRLPNVPCVILAGGQSRRFGANKALAQLGDKRLIDLLISRLDTQTRGPIVINSEVDLELTDRAFIHDSIGSNIGPLAGIHAALSWARENGLQSVITVPVDTPILPNAFVAKLWTSGAPSVAMNEGKIQAVHGIWCIDLLPDLEAKIRGGMRAVRDWVKSSKAKPCMFETEGEVDPFFNVNTVEDLAELDRLQSISPR